MTHSRVHVDAVLPIVDPLELGYHQHQQGDLKRTMGGRGLTHVEELETEEEDTGGDTGQVTLKEKTVGRDSGGQT